LAKVSPSIDRQEYCIEYQDQEGDDE